MNYIRTVSILVLVGYALIGGAFGDDLLNQIQITRTACSGISDSMSDLKKMAGINTAITAVGTVAGGVALGTGIAKANVDKQIISIENELEKLKQMQGTQFDTLNISANNLTLINSGIESYAQTITKKQSEISEMTNKSKKLGTVRTGTLAASMVADTTGAIIATQNKVSNDLQSRIDKCVTETNRLKDIKMQARIEQNIEADIMEKADKIISGCSEWQFVDLSQINKKASGAAISSGTGAALALVGTITSASANSDSVRNNNSDSGKEKEKNLNTASNILAGGTTAASSVATIFNAAQINVIKKAVNTADKCEEALK